MSWNDFRRQYKVKSPNFQMRRHYPDFVTAQIEHIDNLLNVQDKFHEELSFLKREWTSLLPKKKFSLGSWITENGLSIHPPSAEKRMLIGSVDDIDLVIENIHEALALAKDQTDVDHHKINKTLNSWLRQWTGYRRRFESMDFSGVKKASDPKDPQKRAKSRQKKAERSQRDRELRNKMRGKKK